MLDGAIPWVAHLRLGALDHGPIPVPDTGTAPDGRAMDQAGRERYDPGANRHLILRRDAADRSVAPTPCRTGTVPCGRTEW
jgi:hypothetical protein